MNLSTSFSSSKSLSRVPSFEELPSSPPNNNNDGEGATDLELQGISVEDPHARSLFQQLQQHSELHNSEIQIAFEEQRQHYEHEHLHDDPHQVHEESTAADHLVSVRTLAQRFDVSVNILDPAASKGLTDGTAKERWKKHGPNSITPAATVPEWKKFGREFSGVFSIMLELAGLGCFANYALQNAPENLFLGIALWLVVIISGSMNYHQTRKSSRVMNGFGGLIPQRTVVVRDGQFQSIAAEELVPGDILRVKGGDKIPADMRIIHCSNMKVDNSSLTGESEALTRTVETTEKNPFEAPNLAFMGTLCLEGEGLGIVIATGNETVLGKTAKLALNTTVELTVLQKEIKQFVQRISVIGVSIGIIVLVISIATGVKWLDSIVFGVGSIVAIVPEGLQLTVTLALTLTAGRMARNHVLVKKLAIVETLGCTSVICSDKTGTLTQNNMTVSYIVYDNHIHECNELKHTRSRIEEDNIHFRTLSRAAVLCNRAFFDPSDAKGTAIIGDASESALLRFTSKLFNVDKLREEFPKVLEIPFNSLNKWQLSIHKQQHVGGEEGGSSAVATTAPFQLLLKGAPERVLAKCSTAFFNGEIHPLDDLIKSELEAIIGELGSHGQRVLGFAQLTLDPTTYPPDYAFNSADLNFPVSGLTFIGFISIYDPPRDKVDEAVRVCQGAGIKVVMVTGDHPATAKAIAKQIGIIKGATPEELLSTHGEALSKEEAKRDAPAIVIAGTELEHFTKDDWDIVTSKQEIVFARTSPEQKLMIVSQFQERGEIVAVTGDGVNDSPALKKADVGVAMGITGSAVAKEAADIILMDDNFVTIVQAVEEGRLIFDNLKKSIAYALSAKLPEVLPFLSFIILGLPLPLSTVLVLCIDIGTDLIPGIALAYEKAELTLMTRRPRNPKKHRLVSVKLIFFSLIHMGIIQAVSGFTAYFVSMDAQGLPPSHLFFSARKHFKSGAPDFIVDGKVFDEAAQLLALHKAQTAFFCSIILTQLADAIVVKTRFLSFFQQNSRNFLQLLGMIIAVLVAVLFAYVPGVEDVLGTHPISGIDWLLMLPFSVFMFLQDELRKYLIRRDPKGKIAKYTYW
jgi:sodium/potassium-transporting ATPase subunit alpha